MSSRFSRLALFLLAACIASTTHAGAQTLTINGSTANVTVASGQDFATTIIGDPWDFSNVDDYTSMFSSGFDRTSMTVASGRFTGTATTNPSLQIQFEGIDGALNIVGRNGVRFPIASSVYNRISFRMRRNRAPHEFDLLEATWFQGTTRTLSNTGGRYALSNGYDSDLQRYVNQSPLANHDDTSYHIYKFDVDGAHPTNRGYQTLWEASAVRGLSLRLADGPAVTAGTMNGASIDVDWVRLTRRGTQTVTLAWSGFSGAVTLTATNGTDTIQIYPDNGMPDTTFPSNGSLPSWDYGFLPPGTWEIKAQSGLQFVTRTLVISAAPIIHLTEPDATGGRDFARAVIGDALDMTNSEDISRYGLLNNISSAAYADTGLTATTSATGPIGTPNIEDPAVYLLTDDLRQGTSPPTIDANTYRHLTFTIDYDHPELTSAEALGPTWGGVTRVIWRRKTTPGQGGALTTTQDIFVLDSGPHTYSIDLASLTRACEEADCHLEPTAASQLWSGEMGTFRIDPFESQNARQFTLSNLKLAADDEPNANGFFVIKWSATDANFTAAALTAGPAVAGATVHLYYDTDNQNAADKVRITPLAGVSAGDGQFAWNMAAAGLTTGQRYYIYAEIIDSAGNTQARYSTGAIRMPTGLSAPTDSNGNDLSDAFESTYGVSDPAGDEDLDGASNLAEYQAGTDPRLSNTWNLAEGSTGFFEERIALANPGSDQADVAVTFLRPGGASSVVRDYTVPAQGRLTIPVNTVTGLSNTALSAVVSTSRGGVVTERTMRWSNTSGSYYGGHTGKAVQGTATTWYFAEGSQGFFDTYVLLANSSNSTATVTVTFLTESDGPFSATVTVGPQARQNVYAGDYPQLVGKSFSITVQSNVAIIAERAMYFGSPLFNGGHASAGVTTLSTDWNLAEGATGSYFDTYVLIGNPQSTAVSATVTFLKSSGAPVVKTYNIAAQSRVTINVEGEDPSLANTAVSTTVTATQPVMVERAMYWPGAFTSWFEAHNSFGVTSTGTKWALAEGEVGSGESYETYILLANPSTSATAAVTITYLRAGGAAPVVKTYSVAPSTRFNVHVNGMVPELANEKFGALVESTNGVPIFVERALYWNASGVVWAAGTNETAVKLR